MQRGNKKKDESLKARRERNRRAQHDFRLRRQAAEEAQRRRIQHLEDTVEELSNVLISLCDEMITTKEIASQPSLMARLQHSTTLALGLARSVSNTDESGKARETEDDGGNRQDDKTKEKHPKKGQTRKAADASLPQPSSHQYASCELSLDTDSSLTFDVDTDDSINAEMRSSLNIAPLVEQAWPKINPDALSIDSFPIRLVEATLSRACLSLNGELYIPAEEMERAFGSTLRLRTRQQLSAYMQWLLGPGRNDIYYATGINWNPAAVGEAESCFDSVLPFPDNGRSDKDSSSDHASSQAGKPEFLTAMGVQEQLQSLGAKTLSPDTLELCINSPGSSGDGTGIPGSTSGPSPEPSTALRVRLNTSLLTTNLSYVAKCLEKGPVYPSNEIARAVEASVILVRGGVNVRFRGNVNGPGPPKLHCLLAIVSRPNAGPVGD